MESIGSNFRYLEWKSPEEMHYSSLQWLSELAFIKDEHLFFEDMLKEYTLPIIESELFSKVKELIDQLEFSNKQSEGLKEKIQSHTNRLGIMIDGVDQPKEEKEYKEEHRALLKEINLFNKKYSDLKKEIFEAVAKALKKQKQKRLLN